MPADAAPESVLPGPEYLQKEIPQRVANGPIVFDWYAQIANRWSASGIRAAGKSVDGCYKSNRITNLTGPCDVMRISTPSSTDPTMSPFEDSTRPA